MNFGLDSYRLCAIHSSLSSFVVMSPQIVLPHSECIHSSLVHTCPKRPCITFDSLREAKNKSFVFRVVDGQLRRRHCFWAWVTFVFFIAELSRYLIQISKTVRKPTHLTGRDNELGTLPGIIQLARKKTNMVMNTLVMMLSHQVISETMTIG